MLAEAVAGDAATGVRPGMAAAHHCLRADAPHALMPG